MRCRHASILVPVLALAAFAAPDDPPKGKSPAGGVVAAMAKAQQLRDENKLSQAIRLLKDLEGSPELTAEAAYVLRADWHHALGSLYYTTRVFASARRHLEEARVARERRLAAPGAGATDLRKVCRTYVHLGLIEEAEGRAVKDRPKYDGQAMGHYKKAVERLAGSKDPQDVADRLKLQVRMAAMAQEHKLPAGNHEADVRAALAQLPETDFPPVNRVKALIGLGSLHRFKDFDAARADYQAALDILHGLGRDRSHLEAATCLANLAFLDAVTGLKGLKNPPAALRAMDDAERKCFAANEIARLVLAVHAPTLSQEEQFEMSFQLRKHFDTYLTVAVPLRKFLPHVTPEHVYRTALPGKGMGFATQLWARQFHGPTDPQAAALKGQLLEVNKELARRTYDDATPPNPDKKRAAERQKQAVKEYTDLLDRRNHLRGKLALLAERAGGARDWSDWTPAKVRASLPDATSALVDYYVYERYMMAEEAPQPGRPPALKVKVSRTPALLAFVVRRQGIELVDLGDLGPIQSAVGEWHRNLGAGPGYDPQLGDVQARDVYAKLWQPIEQAPSQPLKGVKSVYISPDGSLGYCPFAALKVARPGSAPKYLLEAYEHVSYVPFPGLMAETPRATAAADGLLLVNRVPLGTGKGTFPKLIERFDDLHGKTVERVCSQRAAPIPVRPLAGKDATAARFRAEAPRAKFLDLYTHGFYNLKASQVVFLEAAEQASYAERDFVARFEPDLRSGLAFADANVAGSGGIMTSADIGELDLHAVALATVGACEGSLGEKVAGEGSLSLQRAFQLAGARKTVTAGWKVDEAATQQLLDQFNKNVFAKGMKPEAALRSAQLAFLGGDLGGDAGRHPCYWAAWVVSGTHR